MVVIKECWDVKNDTRNRLGRRSGQMVVKLYLSSHAVAVRLVCLGQWGHWSMDVVEEIKGEKKLLFTRTGN